jgi:hypothetical protein
MACAPFRGVCAVLVGIAETLALTEDGCAGSVHNQVVSEVGSNEIIGKGPI